MSNSIIKHDAEEISQLLGESCAKLSNKTILITGAAGFLCGYLVDVIGFFNETVLEKPLRVIALDNYIRGVPERLSHYADNDWLKIKNFDVTKPYDSDDQVDFVLHGASIASPVYYRQHPLETIDVNVNGLKNMLELSRDCTESVVFLSSSEIYGDPEPAYIPTPEDYRGLVSCTGPRACYDESKRLGETLCVEYYRHLDVPVKIIRPFNVYGPGQRLDDKRIVPDLLSAVLNKESIVLFSDGRATRSFCYAADFIAGMLLVMLEGENGEAYNVGNDEEISVEDAAQLAARLVSPALRVEKQVSDDKYYLMDNPQRRCPDLSKVMDIGYSPKVSLAEGLVRTIESYKLD